MLFHLLVSSIVLAATPPHLPPLALQFLEDHINLPPFRSISPRSYSSKEISLEKLPSTFLCSRSFMFLGETTIGERLYRPTLILGILLGTTSLRNKVAEWHTFIFPKCVPCCFAYSYGVGIHWQQICAWRFVDSRTEIFGFVYCGTFPLYFSIF